MKRRRKIFRFPKNKAHPDQEAKTPPVSVDKTNSYYSQKISGERLKLCYSIAPPRVKQYLEAEIDEKNTGEGLIVCKDGFKAKTVTAQEFRTLASEFGLVPIVTEVDGSSLFCELRKA